MTQDSCMQGRSQMLPCVLDADHFLQSLVPVFLSLLLLLQDCKGGCFDSASGAAGKVSVVDDQEYGPQDFFGLIEEMRVWRVVRTPEQIRQGMIADDGRGSGGSFDGPGIDKDHKGEQGCLMMLDGACLVSSLAVFLGAGWHNVCR